MKRRGTEGVLAILFGVALVVVGGAALYFVSTISVHKGPASVPSTAAPSAGHQEAAVEEGRRLARALVVQENLPGLSVAVARDGRIVWAEGFGWADVERHAPVTPLTRFRIGSVSMPLTAAAVGLLHDRGRLDLDAPVQRYVPAFPAKQWRFSTRQLMGHVAGIQHQAMPSQHCDSVEEALPIFNDDPLRFRPGSEYRYSVYGWILVSAVVEEAAGEPFLSFMKREVLTPIGMERTAPDEDGAPDRASFYFPRMAQRTQLGLEEASAVDYSCYAGAGAFLSTPSDLVRFGSAMMKPGLLKAETIAMLQRPLRLESGASTGYGLGWKVERVQLNGASRQMVGHSGSSMGGTTSLVTFPDVGLAVAVASNVSYANGVAPFARHVSEAFVKRPDE
jgi:CubicO group peptidase (beta-lactamase class C family)